jgi:transposase
MRRNKVQLTNEERLELQKLISSGVAPARKMTRARILLKVDEGLTKTKISQVLDVTNNTITNVCRSFQTQRLAAIERKKPDREYEHSLDGEAEAHLIAMACGTPPEGQERWTLRLLQSEMVKRNYVDDVSHETIRTALKKTNESLGCRKVGVFLQKQMPLLYVRWKRFWMCISVHTIQNGLKSAWTRCPSNFWMRSTLLCPSGQANRKNKITSMRGMAQQTSSCCLNLWQASVIFKPTHTAKPLTGHKS